MNQRPIFLLGAHKSGTTLLRSLFDGHSQIYVVPIETHYFQLMKYWVDNEYRWQRPQKMAEAEIVQGFCDWIHTCNHAEDEFGDVLAKGAFNENKFKERFSVTDGRVDDKARIEKYFDAIYYAQFGRSLPAKIRVLEKSVENAELALDFYHLFPRAQFIHILRNPYANLVALRRYKSVDFGYPIMRRLLRTLYNNYYYLYRNRRIIKQLFVIRYEDLVSQPQLYLEKLCDFLEISFEDILMTPTNRGEPWEGNSTTAEAFNGIDASRIDRWQSDIHAMEVQYINKCFPFVLRDFGYELFNKKGSFWKPANGENLPRYFANRIYKYLLQEWKF